MTEEIQERGCGMPRVGQMYFRIRTGPNGIPITSFLIDPTIPVPEHLNIPDMGMLFVPRGEKNAKGQEIHDIFDHIGATNYPNVFDWVVEIQHLGFHQLISTKAPLHLITPETKYFAVHDRAGLEKPNLYRPVNTTDLMDPCRKHEEQGDYTCVEMLTNDIRLGEPMDDGFREVVRHMPSFYYQGFSPPENAGGHIKSIFMALPLGHMADLVYYSDGTEEIIDKVESIKLPSDFPLNLDVIEVKE